MGLDEARLLAVVPERSADTSHSFPKGVVIDVLRTPDGRQKLRLLDQTTSMCDEVKQNLKGAIP